MYDLGPDFFEAMVESVGVGVAIYGDDGAYVYVNDAYADLLGADRDRLVGMPLWEVVVGFERDRFGDYWDSFELGETRENEAEHRLDGERVPVQTVTTRRTIDGEPYNFGTVRDISERKARERQLQRQNERLDSFAGVVAHDLRNPLNVAQGYLEILAQEVDREEVDLVDSALGRIETLIDDLLALAREGEDIDELEEVVVGDAARQAWATTRGTEAELTVAGEVTVAADGARLVQLLENLFGNAVDHAGPEVSVTVGPLDGGGFYVADDGLGVPEGEREQVFEPGHSTGEEGTGFGLAIVREIAQAHDWTVSVGESAAGGARFEVRT